MGKTDFHVDISKSPRGDLRFSTWRRKNSSEESNETSEEMNHAHVENKKYPRGDLRFSTWIFEKGGNRTNFPVNICKATRGEDHENPWADTLHYNELIYASLVANV